MWKKWHQTKRKSYVPQDISVYTHWLKLRLSYFLCYMYSRGGNSGNPYMYHLYIHMLGPPVFTKISITSCLYLTFIAFIRKEKLLCLSSSSIISLTSLFQSILSHISPYCPSRQLLPLYPCPRLHTHDLETLKCLATMPQDQQRSKNRGSWVLWAEEWSWTWQNFATTVWRKKLVQFWNVRLH